MVEPAPLCPETGRPMTRGVRSVRLTYKAESVTVDMPGWYADGCEDGIHSPEDAAVSDRALAALKVRADGLLAPEEIRRIRLGLGLSHDESARLVGVSPAVFERYESGEAPTSRAASNLLRVLDMVPEAVARLRQTAPART